MKTVLFVPGFREDQQTRDYKTTITAIEKKGYKVVFVPIQWKRTTIQDWVEELEKVYSKYDSMQTILAGFSYGAMTAFVAATHKNPSELWLFSLSPYFAEDLKSKNMKPIWLKQIGKRRVAAFSGLNFSLLSRSISCKTLLFTGQREIDKWPIIGERHRGAQQLLKNNKSVIISGAGHDVADAKYIEAIIENL